MLLLDEPTSALSLAESANLFTIIRRLKAQGIAIVFVSHRLPEIFEIADRITVMRDGQLVGSYDRSAIDPEQAVRLMVGRVLSRLYPPRAQSTGPPRLELRAVRSGPVGPVDLTVHAGEIVGLAGLVGSGRSRLVRALFGVERIDDGMVLVEGRSVRLRSPWHAVRRGMGMVPSDRKGEGVFQRMSLERNLLAAALNRITRMGLVQPRAGRRLGQELVRALGIRARGLDQAMVRLSGGNQQKAVLARWIATRPRVLIVDEPTQGIDVGAKAEIHRLLRQLANDGLAVLMVSSDLPELLGMCDRIAVMAGGRVQAVFDGRSATEEGVMTLAAGSGAA
ncbi:MAG: sugar ABC transporter ATP-binding protein [Chloroflexi bacterium]|nr:MAG: sugar ABC transporter ATP-binding protein [Chloroflexota bacterium]